MTNQKFLAINILAILLLATACGDDDSTNPDVNVNINGNEEGYEHLGRGYDVFSTYADPDVILADVLNRSAMLNANLLEKRRLEKSEFNTASGTSLQEYSTSLTVNSRLEGGFMFFRGAIEASFSQSRYTSTQYSFATVQSLIKKYSLLIKLNVDAEELQGYLDASAQSDLNDSEVAPEDIFRIYGTHVITGLVAGGRLDYSVSANMTQVDEASMIGLYAEASFKKGFASANLSVDTRTEEHYSEFEATREAHLITYGGDSALGQNIINDGDYQAWISSISQQPAFCDFTQAGLLAIWELCEDEDRKLELEAAYEAYAAEQSISPVTHSTCILDLRVTLALNPPAITEDGYRLLDMDLNDHTGGNWVRIQYKLGYDDDPDIIPINEIYTVNPSDGESDPYPGGTRIEVDLNSGAGGDYIYLHYTRGSDNQVRSIVAWNRTRGAHIYSLGGGETFTYYYIQEIGGDNMQDTNESIGGSSDIFLGYSRDLFD